MMRRMVRVLSGVLLVNATLALSACGDPKSEDHRGYTKAPLEHAGAIIKGEEPSEMNKLRGPLTRTTEVIPPPADSAGAKK